MKTKGIYFLYRVLQALALPVLVLYFLIRSARNHAYFTSLRQRLGWLPRSLKQTVSGAIWLHAVSVGEVIAMGGLIRRLGAEFPGSKIFVSATTLAGYAAAQEKLATTTAGVFYVPIDYVFAVRRALRTLRPALVIVAETEIWPNLFREAKRAGCTLVIVNGRISDRTARRYRGLRWFFRAVMQAPDAVLVQSERMRERYLAMGAPAERLRVVSNLKYDSTPRPLAPDSPVRRFIEGIRPASIWIAASTMPPAHAGDVDEDRAVIAAFRELAARHPRLLLVLAPRKPERFETAAARLAQARIRFALRSVLPATLELPGVLLLDSIGELASLFPLADVVFMGGTLAERGGHNILEPAFFARPIVCGPHLENFSDIAEEFRKQGAYQEIEAPSELAGAVEALLATPAVAEDIGRRALACAQSKRGATERAIAAIHEAAAASSWPHFRHALGAWIILWPLSWIWRAVSAWKFRRHSEQKRRLRAKVISVGNITMGGTGKTPFVLHLVRQLKQLGHQPGILSRGYGRQSLDAHLILEPGARIRATQSGDEPQIFLRDATAPVGIGIDRFETGSLLEQRFGSDVLILDDGFQHVQLDRQVDIVLIDALAPFGGGDVFPLGRLREPPAGLDRADILVITRNEGGRRPISFEPQLRQYNAHAPIFHARTVPLCWVEEPGGHEIPVRELPFRRVGAFCGLGNPESFWRLLALLGLQVAAREEFPDHHYYRPQEIRNLARQFEVVHAQAVVTTEKDAINLAEGSAALMAPLHLYWLKIGVEIDREAEFLDLIEHRLGVPPRAFTARCSDSPTR